jgi:hypothetical protein
MRDDIPAEPELATDPRLHGVLDELRAREPIFHRPELGTSRTDFEAQTAPDYWETGASGRRYSREFVWATLEERRADPGWATGDIWQTGDFQVHEIAPATYLLTYTLRQVDRVTRMDRVTRRLTVWQQVGGRWVALYHQGTVVDE